MVEFFSRFRRERPLLALATITVLSVLAYECARPKSHWHPRRSKHGERFAPRPVLEVPDFFKDWRGRFLAINEETDRRGLLRGIFLGDEAGIPSSERELFHDAGLSHLLSASGFNCWIVAVAFGLIGQGALLALGGALASRTMLRIRFLAAPTASLCGASLFWLWSNQSPPITRSVVMIAFKFLFCVLAFRVSFPRLLLVQYLLSMAISPALWRNASFQLTFCCLFGLILLPAHVNRYRPGRLEWLWDYLVASLGACLGAMPVTWLKFGEINLSSVTTNWFAVPLVSLFVMPLGLAQMLVLVSSSHGAAVVAHALGVAGAWFVELLVAALTLWSRIFS